MMHIKNTKRRIEKIESRLKEMVSTLEQECPYNNLKRNERTYDKYYYITQIVINE